MNDPYVTMGLSLGADEAAVRQRYLDLVRQHPPDRSPERFTEIRGAYEALRDPIMRLEKTLFDPQIGDSLDAIVADLRGKLRAQRFSTETLLSLAENR